MTSLAPESATPEPAHSPVLDEADITPVRAALRSPRRLRTEVLAGLVVALALIPEAISFSIIAGVDPRVGLFASFIMAVSISFLGGRPAMISAATGAIALVIAPVMRDHGFDYFIATVILAGILQIVLGVLGVARLMRFIPHSVMVGFVKRAGHSDFPGPAATPDRRALPGLPAGRGWRRGDGLPAQALQGGPGTTDRDSRRHPGRRADPCHRADRGRRGPIA
ncbi:SulP family inorganic anion transporter [Kribbella sp. CA-293567]|uniref:SulP family inorganic anion transporter n=1 Tax=Kribbella sp. CA-293567 TaxID=3002436 RepID=UPI0022DCFF79|nr:SulP family inorganic anion transporter [Kribbella sp. CA-293567]WBQ03400.1 SulP family inorganic anion transporter [Kribbella sp. CA-293567]